MDDTIRFHIDRDAHPDYSRIMYIRQLIAFFPEQGFVAFEGYGTHDAVNLPCTVDVWDRMVHCIPFPSGVFQIRITESYKKALPTREYLAGILTEEEAEVVEDAEGGQVDATVEKESDAESESFDDWVNKRVCLSPNLHIVIYRFDVIKERRDKSIPLLRVCIDDRFETVEGLMDTYLSLPDLPDHCYWYEPPVADVPFFEGYYGVVDKEENMFQAEWNDTFDAIRRKKSPHEDHKMVALLQEWKRLYQGRSECTSPAEHYQTMLTFLSWIEDHLPAMETWCTDYLASMTLEEKLRGWLTYGVEQLASEASSAYLEAHWRLFFRGDGEECDIVTLHGEEFDISYRHSRSLLHRMKEEAWAAENAFGNLHVGIPCDGEGLSFCSRCQEARTMKAAEVYRSYRQGKNVFVNWECGKRFMDAWLYNVNQMSEAEKATIHYVWPPEIRYHTEDIPFHWIGGVGSTSCTREGFVKALVSQRRELFDPQLPREAGDEERFLTMATSMYQLPHRVMEEGPNRWNEVYLFFRWFLSFAPTILRLDKEKCQALLSKERAHHR